jgi:hypothetical protein
VNVLGYTLNQERIIQTVIPKIFKTFGGKIIFITDINWIDPQVLSAFIAKNGFSKKSYEFVFVIIRNYSCKPVLYWLPINGASIKYRLGQIVCSQPHSSKMVEVLLAAFSQRFTQENKNNLPETIFFQA